MLADRGIDSQAVAAQAGKPDADQFGLLSHLALPMLLLRLVATACAVVMAGLVGIPAIGLAGLGLLGAAGSLRH